jgi:membrane protein implicated in regulation of membrane protease activity
MQLSWMLLSACLQGVPSLGNWVNWLLLIGGLTCAIIEMALGAFAGFDLVLIGGSLAIGGLAGLLANSAHIGLLAAGALALTYLALLRGWLQTKFRVKDHASNVDAVVGKNGVVTKRIGPNEPGMVRVGSELWRAEMLDNSARNAGETVVVQSVEGVTLRVK